MLSLSAMVEFHVEFHRGLQGSSILSQRDLNLSFCTSVSRLAIAFGDLKQEGAALKRWQSVEGLK